MLDSEDLSPKFIESAGGPLIVISSANLPDWEGIDEPSAGRIVNAEFRWNGPGSPATDYDRACDVKGYVSVLPVAYGTKTSDALILGDQPFPTAILQHDTLSLPLIVRCVCTESEEVLSAALSAISTNTMLDSGWSDQDVQMTFTSSPLCLFDSALPGSDSSTDDNCITFDLPRGTYGIARYRFNPIEETLLDLYRFEIR